MSQVLKALQKSQQEYEQAQLVRTPVIAERHSKNKDSATSWLLVGAVGILIGASVKFYLPNMGKPVDELTYRAVSTMAEKPVALEVEPIVQQPLELTFLDSQTKELEPLPRITPSIPATVVASTPSRPEVKPEPVTAPHTQSPEWNLSQLDLSGLSPELASQVSSILKESPTTPEELSEQEKQDQSIKDLETHSGEYHGKLPPLNLQTHMYASNPTHRWVKINGQELQEGSATDSGVKLMQIAPRYVVIEYQGEKLKLPALYDWAG
ncbi:general secretion pathway protein B [Vibrio ishigakensis]|uniref:General secretion pathway protein B n=1 Tax=Vibrio ishigakensis TaxID=1481914 RepID=A0A0B8QBB1_9VIBR|nr:general secretion pathway protein B [Vibrio ishigakensis]